MAELCRDFLEKYGSHVSTGTVHFGGTYEWKSEYTGEKTDDSQQYKQDVSDALKCLAEGSGGALGFSGGVKASAEVEKSHSSGRSERRGRENSSVKTTVTQV